MSPPTSVLATLMDANFLGYDTVLVEDVTATSRRNCSPARDALQCAHLLRLFHYGRGDDQDPVRPMNGPVTHRSARAYGAWKIQPADSNYFAFTVDAEDDRTSSQVIEIFEVGGKTLPSRHRR